MLRCDEGIEASIVSLLSVDPAFQSVLRSVNPSLGRRTRDGRKFAVESVVPLNPYRIKPGSRPLLNGKRRRLLKTRGRNTDDDLWCRSIRERTGLQHHGRDCVEHLGILPLVDQQIIDLAKINVQHDIGHVSDDLAVRVPQFGANQLGRLYAHPRLSSLELVRFDLDLLRTGAQASESHPTNRNCQNVL